jgi:glycosyltransferase involved in cell wall biosynthesis
VTEFAPALKAARRTGAKAIVTAHGYDVTSTIDRSRSAKRKTVLKKADGVIAVSSYIAERVISLGAPAEKVHVLPIGIPIPPAPRREVRGRVVLFVGRLSEKKGVLDLLDAVDLLGDVVDRLVIVGDGPLEERVRERSSSCGVPVEMTGALDPAGVRQQMIAADVFCGPSKTANDGDSEGFGLVFLEAAAAELPVVAYSHGGVVEAVENGVTGFLCPEGDVRSLADAIRKALDPAVGRIMGEAGRARVEKRFDILKCTERLEDYMDGLLSGREGSR